MKQFNLTYFSPAILKVPTRKVDEFGATFKALMFDTEKFLKAAEGISLSLSLSLSLSHHHAARLVTCYNTFNSLWRKAKGI